MTFVNVLTNPETIIKDYVKNGDNYTVSYMDGSESSYYCVEENHGEILRQTMLLQAYERQGLESINMMKTRKDLSLVALLLSVLCTVSFIKNKHAALSPFTILLMAGLLIKRSEYAYKLKELKKYKLFFELLPHLDDINRTEFLKHIEFDTMYQTPLDINTVDEYTYGEMKAIYKRVKTLKK